MLIAYKGFNKDLSCTSGGHKFQYKTDVWNEEPEANCRKNGFHCAENPLDCLSYYSNIETSVYYMVLCDGDINEDGTDTKISCTRLKLVQKLNLQEFVAYTLRYMIEHPLRDNSSNHVSVDKGKVYNKFIIVRGKNPIAKGTVGNIIGFAKEELETQTIIEVGMYVVDGINVLPNTWYNICGKIAEKGDSQ